MDVGYNTKEEVVNQARKIIHKRLRDFVPKDELEKLEFDLIKYGNKRKGHLGDLVERYLFGIEPNNKSEPDFLVAGVELKTTPLKKHKKNEYIAKERLVFSMIDYKEIINEKWETSSFLKKNKLLLLMFYLYELEKSKLDYEFKFLHLLDLLNDISVQDIAQIRKDWEFIVAKIKRGEAHLLSEGDTYYLGAVTKARDSLVLRDQPAIQIPAKPRAFSLKKTYLDYLIQTILLGKEINVDSIFKDKKVVKTIEDYINEKFSKYIGKTEEEILNELGWSPTMKAREAKGFRRMLINKIFNVSSQKILELEKANITMKVIALESEGGLKESISFPYFRYKKIVDQKWNESHFYNLLQSKKFLFVVFQKMKNSNDCILKKVKFWNFPMQDMNEVKKVWDKTIECIENGTYTALPKISENRITHVRPHGRNSKDTIITPQGTQEVKRCFWLNAGYICDRLNE